MPGRGAALTGALPAGRERRKGARPVLRRVHATLGLFAAFYLLMAAATGAVLMFRAELLALTHPELGPVPSDTIGQAQRLVARLAPGSFTSIEFPDAALPAFTVNLEGHRTQLYDPATLRPLGDPYGIGRALDWSFELHHYLLAGETGRLISGAFGLVIAALVLIGLYLWWPWRRGWRLAHARAKRPTRASHLAAHTTLGILMAPALFVAALTGGAIVFSEQSRVLLVALLGSRDAAVAPPADSGSLAELARRTFPGAVPRILSPPDTPGAPLGLRLRQPEEAHPNGRTRLGWDPATARATAASSARDSGAGNRAFDILYPIHIGTIGGLPLRLFYLASSLIALLAATHALRARLRPRRR